MTRSAYIFYCLFLFEVFLSFSPCSYVLAKKKSNIPDVKATEIMREVIARSDSFARAAKTYDADFYIKIETQVKKKNFTLKLVPSELFLFDPSKDTNYVESYSRLKYFPYKQYSQKLIAVNGSSAKMDKSASALMKWLVMIDIYKNYTIDDVFEYPVSSNAFKRYNFRFEETKDTLGVRMHKIAFTPRFTSSNLLKGEMWIVDGEYNVYDFRAEGAVDFVDFSFHVVYGVTEETRLLPQHITVFGRFVIAFNVIENMYAGHLNYNKVENEKETARPGRKNKHDLSANFLLKSDSIIVVRDTAYWSKVKSTLVSSKGVKDLYPDSAVSSAYLDVKKPHSSRDVTNFLTSSSFDYKWVQLKYPGILNPGLFGYSGTNGFTYKQTVLLSKSFSSGQYLATRPEIGYASKVNQLFYKLPFEWSFLPANMGQLKLTVGNKNRTLSSEFIKQNHFTKSLDSIPQFSKENYYRDDYGNLSVSVEAVNGLIIRGGLNYHFRQSQKKYYLTPDSSSYKYIKYHSFSPEIGFSYTPGQYYRYMGKRKVYLYSYWPTFSFEYSRSIKGVLGSDIGYERIEAEIHQSLKLGLMNRFKYSVSGGWITNAKSVYFADFNYFAKDYFPSSWDEKNGSSFALLDSYWYNASNAYFQLHTMLDMQLLSRYLPRFLSRYVFREQIYFGGLISPVLDPYSEYGYGIGNRFLNAAVFVALDGRHYQGVGFRVEFRLVNL